MLFNSLTFVIFLTVVYGVWRALPGFRARNGWLLLASYVFYGAWDWRFLGLIFLSTAVDYFAARFMHGRSGRARKAALVVSLCVNLGMLGLFKYLDFGIESMLRLLAWIGVHPGWGTVELILPVGISFYTFQTISYTVDVYRNVRPPETDPLTFALYVAFFPQLVAGPIEQSTHLLPQLKQPRKVERADVAIAFHWMLLGYVKKVVIADTLAPIVNAVFAAPEAFSPVALTAGLVGFALQIYGDFCGYTLIARGVARLFGIDLLRNFRHPYFAVSPRDFWRRWHVSLSTWLRDYLYIPLGGSRGGRWFTARNLMLTMLLGGLWHGASWLFVIWGAYHGVLLVLCHLFLPADVERSWTGPRRAAAVAVTFVLTLGGWLLFRSPDLATLGAYLRGLAGGVPLEPALDYLLPVLTFGGLLGGYHAWTEHRNDELALLHAPPQFRIPVYIALLLALIICDAHHVPFIYFQF